MLSLFKKRPLFQALFASIAALSLSVSHADDSAKPCPANLPKPTAEHAWLQQLVGRWDADVQTHADPTGKEPEHSKVTEDVRPVGGFWVVSENTGTMMGSPFKGIQTLGYDVNKQKYTGTWVDSISGNQWQFEGSLDPSGKILTLEGDGFCPMAGKPIHAKDVLEVSDKNHKVFKSFIQDDKGQWIQTMTIHYQRK